MSQLKLITQSDKKECANSSAMLCSSACTCTLISATTHIYFLAVPPKITTHPKELIGVFLGKTVSFTVQATGTESLKYQWEWKPAGKKGSEEWQNISCDGSRFQQMEGGGLKLTGVQACNAGHYRCIVSNSAGSEISQCTNLVIGKCTVSVNSIIHTLNL